MLYILLIILSIFHIQPVYAGFADGDGRKTVATAGTAEALSSTSTMFASITICAELDNTGLITVGTSPIASLSTREGIPLNAGDCFSEDKRSNLTAIKIDATVSTDGVTFRHTG